jgi:DNA-binding PadR family transcriptional regulator
MSQRELTTLEYMVLGQISLLPQSGYSIIHLFGSDLYRWSASPGAIYPILKRLEEQKFLASELELVHETRPRKIYSLTPLGESILDKWLKRPPTKREVSIERDILLIKFLYIEKRLNRTEVLAWLDAYDQEAAGYEILLRIPDDPEMADLRSVHYQLIIEAARMEAKMQREWIQRVRQRLQSEEATVSS